jgi:DNA-binding response OmpR family regulator
MPDIAELRPRALILLVEDEPLIRMLAVEMLCQLDFAAVEASSASEALQIADQGLDRFAALMIDLGLPDQPGENVIRRVRHLRPDLPVFITTGADTAAAAHRLDDCGLVAFLEKPYSFKELEAAVANLSVAG